MNTKPKPNNNTEDGVGDDLVQHYLDTLKQIKNSGNQGFRSIHAKINTKYFDQPKIYSIIINKMLNKL